MNKTYQRMILIVAIVICGLAYGLQSWQQNRILSSGVDTTPRAMRLLLQNSVLQETLQKADKFWLMTLNRSADDPISVVQDKVMGGLGSKVLAMQLMLDNAQGRTEWQQSYSAEYPKILQIYPPETEIPAILKHLRVCEQNCQNRSRFLYLINSKDFSVYYYGDRHWNILALVQDIQSLLEM